MYNEELAKRKEGTRILIIVGFFVVFIIWALINSYYNPPEKVFNDCVKKYHLKKGLMQAESRKLIEVYCCLEMDYVPILDYKGNFFLCQNPQTDDATSGIEGE